MCAGTKQELAPFLEIKCKFIYLSIYFTNSTASVEVETDSDDDVTPPLQQGAPIGTN